MAVKPTYSELERRVKELEKVNNVMEPWFIHDVDTGAIVDISDTMLFLFGYKREEMAEVTVADLSALVAPYTNEHARELIKKAASGETVVFEWLNKKKNGELFYSENILKPVTIAGKERIMAIVKDATERKKAEAELVCAQVMLRETILQAPHAMALMSTKDSKFKIINRAAEEFLMIDAVDYLEKKPEEMEITWQEYAPDGRKLELNELPTARGLRGLVTYGFESRTVRRDGSELWTLSSGAPIYDSSGSQIAVLLVMQDISERKRAEAEATKLQAQLTQAQKMESVGLLAGGVAHDFNNMLCVILGHAELALDEVSREHPLFLDLQEIQNAGKRSADLIRQLLAFARKQTVAPQEICLNECVEGMLHMLRRLIGEDVDLSWQPWPGRMPVFMDPSQLDQILTNLCVNAKDAISGVGKIIIESGRRTFDDAYCAGHADAAPGEYVMLAVSDNGCGMNKEVLDHIFEPFFTTKEVGKGTGLGLATIYGIVRQNKGFINVYSELGRGTTFNIYLPYRQSEIKSKEVASTGKTAACGDETILLVEDDLSLLKLTTMMLERRGYTVIGANTPGDAIRLAGIHASRIDLLMTDVIMPEMNGRDLAGQLLSVYPGMQCLFMSGYTADVIARHGVLDEDMRYIQKPFSKQELLTKVQEALCGAINRDRRGESGT